MRSAPGANTVARGCVIKRRWKDGRRLSYAIKYRLPDGTQKFETIGPSKKEAERVLSRRLDEINRGAYRDVVDISFAEFADKWMAEYVRPRLKPSTIVGYESQLRSSLVPEFGPLRLSAITAASIHAWIATLTERGLSPASVNHALAQLKFMLSHAVDSNHLGANPAEKVPRLRVPYKEMKVWEPEQIRRFLDAVDPPYRLYYATAVLTGVRRGEIQGLQWQDVDWKRNQLRVARNYYKGQLLPPKSRTSVRRIDLAPSLLEALRKAKPSGVDGESHIFLSARSLPLDPATIKMRVFVPACERAGVPRIRFHDLRHTFAALLVAAGHHPKYIQVQMGHSSIQMTLDLYGHLLPDVHEGAGVRLERTVFGCQESDSGPRPAEQNRS